MSAMSAETAPSTESPLPFPLPALRLVPAPPSAPPYDDEITGAPVLRLVASLSPPAPPPAFNDEAWLAAERTPTAQLPAARTFAHTLVQGLLEVLAGVRPLSQLRRDTTPELYASLRDTVTQAPRVAGARPPGGAVRSLHVQERPEGIVEVCATVERGARLAAVALRLEGLDGRWKCTELLGV